MPNDQPLMPSGLTRRSLLAGGVAVAGIATTRAPLAAAAGSPWVAAKTLFRLGEGIIPMNAANLTPLPQPSADTIAAYAQHLNQDVSFINRRDLVKDKVRRSRQQLAAMLGIEDEDDLAFVRNTSEANAVICNGLDLQPQDEVLLWDQNHATNHRSWFYRQQRTPFKIRQFQLPDALSSQQQVLDAVMSQVGARTRVVAFSELSNISGIRLPAKALSTAIHEHNPDILVHVDGAQSWGSLDLNLAEMGCDSFSASSHKWFMGPRGTGILFVRKKWAERIWPSTLGYDFLLDYPMEELPDNARRFECIGQRDVAPYAAIGDCVALYHQLGGSLAIEQRVRALTVHAIKALDRAGIATLTPKRDGLGHAVVVIDMGSTLSAYGGFLALHNQGIASAFVTGGRVCCSPQSGRPHEDAPTYLRLSPHIYNSFEDIDRAVEVITRIHRSKFEIIKEVVRFL